MRLKTTMDFKGNNSARLEFRELEQITEFINVSHLDDVLSVPNGNEGFKGFQLSDTVTDPLTPLDGTYKFFDDEKGYSGIITNAITRKTSSSDGYAIESEDSSQKVCIRFHISNEMPEIFFIVFDTVSSEYAPYFIIYGENAAQGTAIYNNTSPVVILNVKDGLLGDVSLDDTFRLEISYWSKPNTSIKVSRIATYPRFEFNSKDITKMLCSENLFDSALHIRPGICEQYATIDVYDRYGVLHSMYIREELTKKNEVSIYAIDDAEQKTYLLGSYMIASADAECDNNIVTIECEDNSRIFEEINVPALPVQDRTCDKMLSILFETVNKPWKYIDNETANLCKSIKTPNSWSESSSAAVLLEKICILGMLRVYWYIDTFVVARCVNVSTPTQEL